MKPALLVFFLASLPAVSQLPQAIPGGYNLPNGWRITPIGKSIPTEDLLLNMAVAPDGRAVVALHGGFNPHGLVVIDTNSGDAVQRIGLKSAWLGLAWSPDGSKLYVSGGNADGRRSTKAPIYVFRYAGGRLSEQPVAQLEETVEANRIYWSGLAHHPSKPLLFAANKGTSRAPGEVVVFDTAAGTIVKRIPVEVNPYDVQLSADASTLYVSNWASDSISIIDTATMKVTGRIPTGDNPNDLVLSKDGRLLVSCANDNSVIVIDTKKRQAIERISVSLHPNAPAGSTPNALLLDAESQILFVANADNNAVAVVSIAAVGKSQVLGFIPAGWYPSSLALHAGKLYIGNSKGLGSYSNVRGPGSPIREGTEGRGSVKSLQKGSVNIVDVSNLRRDVAAWTKQVYANVPYNDSQLASAKAPSGPSIVPAEVGSGSPIKHVIYIIKENRTYDQVLGDMPKGNGDPRLTIFGRKVTPNHHALAEEFVLLDNLYCDGEVSVDGHSWSTAAYATDWNEKFWPPNYGGHSRADYTDANIPGGGYLWDAARRKGLTYRSYGEYAARSSEGMMEASVRAPTLAGHVAPRFKLPGMRDTDNAKEFIREFDEYERNYSDPNPEKRLPNLVIMSLPENHTTGTRPGTFTPVACVANNDLALGMIVERVTRSKYWPETAIFVIEDDAQDGPDHVDARRTVGLVISPYTKRGIVDSTLYTTSSMLRTMELLLGLPPLSQYDAAATPMYASFGVMPDLKPYTCRPAEVDLNARNSDRAWGARESMEMNLDEIDQAPMFAFNQIIWKSVKGPKSAMPLPVHRFHFPGQAK
jgi:YVTN family beta-propeller protein